VIVTNVALMRPLLSRAAMRRVAGPAAPAWILNEAR
jgi:hypothetical protein